MPRVAQAQSPSKDSSTATFGFEAKLGLAADKVRNNRPAPISTIGKTVDDAITLPLLPPDLAIHRRN